MEKSRCEGRVVGRKGKHRVRAAVNLGQLTKLCRTVSRVSQWEHLPAPVPLKRRGPGNGVLLQLLVVIVVVQSQSGEGE